MTNKCVVFIHVKFPQFQFFLLKWGTKKKPTFFLMCHIVGRSIVPPLRLFFLDVSQNNNRVITFIEVWVWTSLRSVAPAEKQTNKFDCNLNVLFYPSCMCLKCGRKPSDPKKKNLKHRSGSLFHPQVHPKREYKTAHYTQLEDHEGTETNHWRTVLFKSPVLWFVCVVRNSRVAAKQHSNDTFFSPVDSILGNTKIHVSCTYKVKKKYN